MRIEIGVHEGLNQKQLGILIDGLDDLFEKDPVFEPMASGNSSKGGFDYSAEGRGPVTAAHVRGVAQVAHNAGLELGFRSEQLTMALFPE